MVRKGDDYSYYYYSLCDFDPTLLDDYYPDRKDRKNPFADLDPALQELLDFEDDDLDK